MLVGVLASLVAYQPHGQAPTVVQRSAATRSELLMMAKPKKDPRSWLPQRTSQYSRELDVALMILSRAAASAAQPAPIANLVTQALVSDGLTSEFPGDTLIARESAATLAAADAAAQATALELCNELGATNPCVNGYIDYYPEPVKPTELDAAALGAALERGAVVQPLSPRTWLLAPVAEAAQTALSLTLLDMGRPVVCAIALPNLPRNSMGGEKLLRMMVSYDGQSGAVAPPAGTLLWAEEGIGAYERSIGGEHGTDVRVRVDRCLIGKRNIATGATAFDASSGFDWGTVTRCEVEPRLRAAALATELGASAQPVLKAEGPFAYGLVARGEAQTYFELPDEVADFDASIWSHAAGSLLVSEAGGSVTDTAGNALDFSTCGESRRLPNHVVGVIATNKDLHPSVVNALGTATAKAAMA
jgi:3'-phosphoadenosine 5'-phosphosulfate (PAPS) 3'-phosphatase